MKNTIKIYFLFASVIVASCHSQDQKFVDLTKISNDFDVSEFYKNKVKQTNETIATDPKSVGKEKALELLNNAFFVKDTLGYFKTDGRLPTDLSLEPTNDWMVRNKEPTEIFGYGYKTVAHDPEKDTLAIFNTISFPKMDMVEDRKGNLTYLEVGKTSKTIHDFNKIKEYLSKNAKKITVDDNDSNAFYCEDQSFYYFLSKREGEEEEVSYDSQGSRKAKSINVIEINLAMFEKSYIKKMESLQIYSPGNQFWKKQ
ncbi:hypothetical protein ASG22_01470 [Chryseobacterium sp. Leaf405]|uniref:hypothetical protein n=1 Tax=Chryseobacterium sp. Leaf405 TaxID=1736367 RepID=UPI0006FBA360|nr:hypothetical protein [Chryseobacterium sp. Leaf405]KQT35717.1 hypothetical protein ASG22_01470 [Chryseobacterium sp. Leaf405]